MTVEIPLDKICVRSGILCPRCQALVDEGKYNELDVSVMEALLALEKRYRDYNIRFIKAYQIDDLLYVLVEAKPGIPVSLGQDIRRNLRVEGIEKVIVVQYHADRRTMLESLLDPYDVEGIEEAYLPDGSVVLVVKLPTEAKRFIESFKGRIVLRLAEKLLGKPIYVEYVESRQTKLRPEWLDIKKADVKSFLDKLGY